MSSFAAAPRASPCAALNSSRSRRTTPPSSCGGGATIWVPRPSAMTGARLPPVGALSTSSGGTRGTARPPAATSSPETYSLSDTKRALLEAVDGTYRGCVTTAGERALVEEAQVALEGLSVGGGEGGSGDECHLDLDLLAGKWRLVYTTAPDVLSVLRLQRDTGLLEVGDIFQSFTADGKIENEIRLSVPLLLAPATQGSDGGVALKVDADYTRTGVRTLNLTFQEARVSEVRISDTVEALVAPALLPRGSLNHQVLLAIRELELRFPLRGAVTSMGGGGGGGGDVGGSSMGKQSGGVADGAAGDGGSSSSKRGGVAVGSYLLSYLDEDMLVGRAGAGGTFIFKRVIQKAA
uniref:Plastid lipid-associated protein/fibrillin conserved domain-containing protein n=1 Tax=Mantoniella antarctica TaxID=81844 RepID=A0A7S0S736_9CHLO